MKKRLLIGVIITECHVRFQEEILKGVISQAFKSNCDIAVLTPFHDFSMNTPQKTLGSKLLDLILSDRFDGFLYDRSIFRNDGIRHHVDSLLERSGKPVMLLDWDDHRIFESTAIDDTSAMETVTDHMIDCHGHNKIYCLTGPKGWDVSEQRLMGYKNSMKKHGLYYDKSTCIYGDFWKEAAKELARRIISGELARPDAIVCGNDFSAISLVEALTAGGIRVPEDIAVTGYDAAEEGTKCTPTITSYHRPYFQVGSEGFRRLYRIITGRISGKVPNQRIGLRPGCSCGCKTPAAEEILDRRDNVNKVLESDMIYRDMLFDVTSAETPHELADRIDNYTYYIYRMNKFFLCLTDSYMNSGNSNGRKLDFTINDNMTMILGKSSIKRLYSNIGNFSASQLLPAFDEERKYPVAYYFTPLHFKDNFFGYAAVSFGKEPMSFSSLYLFWTNYVNVALEQVRIKSILNNTLNTANRAMLYDSQTGLLNRAGVKKAFSDQLSYFRNRGTDASFIRIQLTGLNDAMYQSDEEKCVKIMKTFASLLREQLISGEILGCWTAYTFAVITVLPGRCEEIFSGLKSGIREAAFGDGESCDIDFTIGVHVQTLDPEPAPSAALHKAAVNRVFSYTVSESTANPQYEKLCILRGRLMKNPELPWNISEIAGNLYLSKSYLQKIYKTYFGKSIIEEMISFRIEKAKELLNTTDMTVTEVARECGYSSYNYFVRQFKNSEGISPSEYRKN